MTTDDFVTVPRRKPGRPKVYPDAKIRRREYMREYRQKRKDDDGSGNRKTIDGDSGEVGSDSEAKGNPDTAT